MKRFLLLAVSSLFTFVASSQSDESWKIYDDTQVSRVDITLHPDTLAWIYDNPESDVEHLATARFRNSWIDQTLDSAGFRLRGNTSRQSQKKSFKVSFNTFIKGRKLLGIEKLNLNGEHNDPAIARSKFSFDRWNDLELPASRTCHATVYINDEYYGLYVSVEHVDEEFLQKRFSDCTGNLWKCLYPADLVYKGEDISAYDDAYELKTNEHLNDQSQLFRLMKRLKQTPLTVLPDTLDKIIDIGEVLKYLAMNTLLGSWDDYRSLMNNYYLYHEPSTGLFHVIPYDYDNTFGVDWFGIDWASADPYNIPKVAEGERPLSDRVLQVPEWRNLYTLFLNHFNEYVFPDHLWNNQPEPLRAMLEPFALNDTYRTLDYGFTLADFNNSFGLSYQNQHVKKGIRQFVADRSSSLPAMLTYVSAQPVVWSSRAGCRYPAPGQAVAITASVFHPDGIGLVEAEYKVNDGSVHYAALSSAATAGSKNVDLSYRWQGSLGPFQEGDRVQWRIKATTTSGTAASWPGSHWHRLDVAVTPESLKVNELMASNVATIADPQGEFDDWAELFNPSLSPVLLTGCYVTDDRTNPAKYQITTPDVVIPPAGYQLIWCDDDPGDPGIHTSFKLSADGEFFGLAAPDGQTWIDTVTFGSQSADRSLGRLPNGTGFWSLMNPTPLASNQGDGFEGLTVSHDFTFAPNPAVNNTTRLLVPATFIGDIQVSFYDLAGRKVGTAAGKAVRGLPVEIITSYLPEGLLVAEINTCTVNIFRKLLISR